MGSISKSMILISGLPGTGKTRLAHELARELKVPLFAKDRLQCQLHNRGLAMKESPDGYHLILDLAEAQLALGVSAILDGVFPLNGFRAMARAIAERHEAEFRPIYCYCSDSSLWKARFEGREWYVLNWTPVGWEAVERIRPTFEAWDQGSTLFLDSVEDLETNLAKALSWVQAKHSPAE